MKAQRVLDGIRRLNRDFAPGHWCWCFLLLVIVKLVLVAHSEIKTGLFDEVGYANSSLHWFGEKHAGVLGFQRPPGMPLAATAARAIGLPYRIAIELLALGGIGFLSFQFGRLVDSYLIAILLSVILALHPWLLANLPSFMSEPPFLAFSLGFLGCLAAGLATDSWESKLRWSVVSGFFLFLMAITRLEEPVLVVFAIVAGVGLIAFVPMSAAPTLAWGQRMRWACLLIPLLVMVAGRQLVGWINYEKCGVAALSCLEEPGLMNVLQTLNSIQAPDPQRYAPITARSFRMAMDASPSLRLLAGPMSRYQRLAQSSPKPYLVDERGWFLMWDLIYSSMEIEADLPTGVSEPAQLNTYWQRCADELKSALREGRLPRAHFAPYPLNPNYTLWVRAYPTSWWKEIRSLCRVRRIVAEADGGSLQSLTEYPWTAQAYDLLNQAADRRPALLPSTFLEGYAYSRSGPVTAVVLENTEGTRLGAALALTDAPLPSEWLKLVPHPPPGPVPCHYALWLPFAIPETARLVLLRKDSRVSTQPIREVYHLESAPGLADADGMAEIRTVEIQRPDASSGWREQVNGLIAREYGWFEALACGLCFLVALVSAAEFKMRPSSRHGLAIFMGILVACLLARCSFYALVDACVLPGWDRYPQTLDLWVSVVFAGAGCLAGRRTGELVKAFRGHTGSVTAGGISAKP